MRHEVWGSDCRVAFEGSYLQACYALPTDTKLPELPTLFTSRHGFVSHKASIQYVCFVHFICITYLTTLTVSKVVWPSWKVTECVRSIGEIVFHKASIQYVCFVHFICVTYLTTLTISKVVWPSWKVTECVRSIWWNCIDSGKQECSEKVSLGASVRYKSHMAFYGTESGNPQ